MSSPTSSLLNTQVRRVNRRLFYQTLINRLVWCLSGALVATVVWLLIQPFAVETPAWWLNWAVGSGLVGVSAILAGVLAFLSAPSRLEAALSLDERFELRERVTTSLTLTPAQQATPAGQALLDDVHQRVAGLNVGSRFPLRLSWVASLVPVSAALVALVAQLYDPAKTPAKPNPAAEMKKPPANKAEIDKRMNELRKRREAEPGERPKSEKLKELEAEMEKLANMPRSTKEEVRQVAKQAQVLEDKVRDAQKAEAQKQRSLKNQLQEMTKHMQEQTQDGPAKDLQKALADGNMEKAKDALEKLEKKLMENNLSEEDKKKLEKQLGDMKDKLERAANLEEKEKKLKQAAKEGKIDAETLEHAMKELQEQKQQMKDMKNLADKLGECQKCMEKGDMQGAGEKLQAAAQQAKEMNLSDKEMQDLQEQMQKLQDAKQACQNCDKPGNKDGEGDGDSNGDSDKSSDKESNGFAQGKSPGMTGPANGRRPQGKEKPFKQFDARDRADFDPKGRKLFDGLAPGQNFRSKTSAEIAGEVQKASQEAPEAIEQTRIPKAARDMAKDYFHNLAGQAEKDKKDSKKAPEKK